MQEMRGKAWDKVLSYLWTQINKNPHDPGRAVADAQRYIANLGQLMDPVIGVPAL